MAGVGPMLGVPGVTVGAVVLGLVVTGGLRTEAGDS
jgi:hypothetical protein